MDKSKKKSITIISVLVLILLVSFGGYKYVKYKDYKELTNKAEAYMQIENYDKAIETYEKILDYKSNKEIIDKINLAKEIKESKDNYEKAMELYNKRDYIGALKLFKKVSQKDSKRYNLAQNKIKECTSKYINDNLDKAKELAKSKKYKEAYIYIDKVLSLDKENAVAKNLKEQYIKEEKSIEEETKKHEEEKKRIGEEKKNLETSVTSGDKAEKIVKNKIGAGNNKTKVVCEREEVRAGVSYYVIHVYEVVEDHTATMGWYYVKKDNGQIFLWNLASDILEPLN